MTSPFATLLRHKSLLPLFAAMILFGCQSKDMAGVSTLNGEGYGGSDPLRTTLNTALANVIKTAESLQSNPSPRTLCAPKKCDADPKLCEILRNLSDQERKAARDHILNPSVLQNFLTLASEISFEISNTPLLLEGNPVDAMTELGPEGPVYFLRREASQETFEALWWHELGHKLTPSIGRDGEDLLDASAACITVYGRELEGAETLSGPPPSCTLSIDRNSVFPGESIRASMWIDPDAGRAVRAEIQNSAVDPNTGGEVPFAPTATGFVSGAVVGEDGVTYPCTNNSLPYTVRSPNCTNQQLTVKPGYVEGCDIYLLLIPIERNRQPANKPNIVITPPPMIDGESKDFYLTSSAYVKDHVGKCRIVSEPIKVTCEKGALKSDKASYQFTKSSYDGEIAQNIGEIQDWINIFLRL